MSDDVYRRLARRLDEIPNGFAATTSGAELRLLEKLFTREEAELACVMRLSPEPAAQIGERGGVDGETAARMLSEMRSNGLIRVAGGESGPGYSLMPFIVGVYEQQLGRMDEEMAVLFENWMTESEGGSNADGGASVHRVIPVDESVPQDLDIFPYERASELLERAGAWGVRNCICRVQQKLIGKGCDHTVENCLVFAPKEGVFDGSGETRPITKYEARRILAQAADEGLVHSTMNQRDQIFYICNCCTCCCGVMRGVAEFGVPTAVARSDFRAVVAEDRCTGCGACVRRCQFGALSKDGDLSVVDYARCVGCGVCVSACAVEALAMERRPEGEVERPPENSGQWMDRKAKERGISVDDVR
ncbi:MAG: 4Fe-4S binding protein [Candidatus Eisenbacteria bacterium]